MRSRVVAIGVGVVAAVGGAAVAPVVIPPIKTSHVQHVDRSAASWSSRVVYAV